MEQPSTERGRAPVRRRELFDPGESVSQRAAKAYHQSLQAADAGAARGRGRSRGGKRGGGPARAGASRGRERDGGRVKPGPRARDTRTDGAPSTAKVASPKLIRRRSPGAEAPAASRPSRHAAASSAGAIIPQKPTAPAAPARPFKKPSIELLSETMAFNDQSIQVGPHRLALTAARPLPGAATAKRNEQISQRPGCLVSNVMTPAPPARPTTRAAVGCGKQRLFDHRGGACVITGAARRPHSLPGWSRKSGGWRGGGAPAGVR